MNPKQYYKKIADLSTIILLICGEIKCSKILVEELLVLHYDEFDGKRINIKINIDIDIENEISWKLLGLLLGCTFDMIFVYSEVNKYVKFIFK